MRRSRVNRAASALVLAAIVISSCSGDDDESSPSTAAPATTTDAADAVDELTGEGLDLGLLAPPTGLLASLYVGQERGVALAVDDVDAGGGVLEGPLVATTYRAEPGSEPTAVVQAAIDGGAGALLGPAGSSDAVVVRDEVAALGSTTCSASATVPSITRDQDDLVLFRTALPDDVTATYLASQIVARRDADAPGVAWKVAIVARADDYGQSIGGSVAAILQAAGLEPNVIGYNPQRVKFDTTADQVVAAAPDVTILVTYAEGANLLSALVRAGQDPATMIGLDAFFAPRIAERSTAATEITAVDGFQILGSMGNKAFLERLATDDPDGAVANAPQAYDCAVVMALARAVVDAGDADTLGEAAIDVTGSGVTCTTYADCLEKLNAGENIDYDGVSGQIALDDNGDPTFARFTTGALAGGVVADLTSTDVDIAEIRRQQEAYAAAAQITKIQQALTFLGFYSGPINGLDTPEFRAALAAFQASVGLPPTGVFDAATDAALRAALGPYAALLEATTADIQRLMTDLGFYTGPIDGIWSEELSDSIRALQRELGVPETGVLDAATLRAVYARGAADATTTTTTAPPATTVPPTTPPATTTPPTTVPPTVPPTTVPTPDPTLPKLQEALAADPRLSDYLRLLRAAAFPADFDLLAQYTLFAPTNDALAAAGVDVDEVIAADTPEELFEILLGTVADGRLTDADLRNPATSPLLMIGGELVDLAVDGAGVLTVNGSVVSPPEIVAFNGIIHVITSLNRG
jgi:branched-chain amino acid transport system substrate-binding protein